MKYSLIILAIVASISASAAEAKIKKHVHVSHKIEHKKVKQIRSKNYFTPSNLNKDTGLVGTASWYGYESGKRYKKNPRTANGDIFSPYKNTAAHRKLPFGTKVKVTNLHNNQSVVVTINDRGPYVKHRIIDLSKAAAKSIGINGLQKVSLDIIS